MPNGSKAGIRETKVLADGNEIPVLGLGVWQVRNGAEGVNAVRWALELGYRHVDTAQAYGNEESVGRGLRESGVPREDVFVTTKFYPNRKDPVAEIGGSLRRLGFDYVDLYIIHWPKGGATWAWPGMERSHGLGLARSIGVSNFSVDDLSEVMSIATIQPVIDQVQFSPFDYRRELLEEATTRQVALEAYSPLGTGRHLSNPDVIEIAEAKGRTTAQVLLRWCLQRNTIVLPKSTHRDRIEENARIFDFELSDDDVARLDSLDRTGFTGRALEHKWW
ncbi:MAG: aldo/keto reductase [Acidimicrobiales bacterium]